MVCCIFCGSDAEICVSYKIDSTCINFFENANLGGSKVSEKVRFWQFNIHKFIYSPAQLNLIL